MIDLSYTHKVVVEELSEAWEEEEEEEAYKGLFTV